MIKGFRQIVVLTSLSRILGFVRDMAYGYFFGANAMLDAWLIAFKIPNLPRRLFGEGAASASLIPVYSHELHADKRKAEQLANTVVTVIFVILSGIVVAGEIGIWGYYAIAKPTQHDTRLILSLSSAMLPYMIFVCIAAILGGILNVHKHFAMPAAGPIVLNIFIICALPMAGWAMKIPLKQQLFFVAVAVLISGISQLVILISPLRKSGVTIRPEWAVHTEAFKKILIMMGPMVLGLTVTQINTLADDIIAWCLSGSPEKGESFLFLGKAITYPLQRGSVSHLYYAQRFYQLPLGIFGISLATAIFPVMSRCAAKKDYASLAKSFSHGLSATLFIALPSTIGLVAVANPLITIFLQRGQFTAKDTEMVVWPLLFYTLGLCGYFAQQVATRVFYSMQDSKTPVKSALLAVVLNFILNLTLVWFMGTGGLAASTAICSYLQVIILSILFQRWLHKQDVSLSVWHNMGSETLKTILASLYMCVAIAATSWISKNWTPLFKLIVIVSLSAGTYLVAAKLMRIEMLSLLTGKKPENAASETSAIYD